MFDQQLEGLVVPVLPRPINPLAVEVVDLVLAKLKVAFEGVQREVHGGVNDPTRCDVVQVIGILGQWVPERAPENEAKRAHHWPEQLANLFDVVFAWTRRRLPEAQAATEARDLVFLIAEYLGGRTLYLPGNDDLRTAVRDAQIYALQGRIPTDEIARRYDLTVQRISMICAEQRQLRVRRLQGELFQNNEVEL